MWKNVSWWKCHRNPYILSYWQFLWNIDHKVANKLRSYQLGLVNFEYYHLICYTQTSKFIISWKSQFSTGATKCNSWSNYWWKHQGSHGQVHADDRNYSHLVWIGWNSPNWIHLVQILILVLFTSFPYHDHSKMIWLYLCSWYIQQPTF